MKKTSILSAILVAGSLMVLGGFGCSHNEPAPAQPNSVSSQATPAPTTGDTTVNPQGTTSGDTGTQMQNPGYQSTTPSTGTMDQRQPVNGTMDKSGNMPVSPSDTSRPNTTKPETTNPDTTNAPGSTIPPK